MLEGFIRFLNSAHREAVELRKRINFFIVPMVNPDGVILGNTRTSAAGKDLNRQFLMANRDLYPEVSLIKDFGKRLHSKYGAFMYLDFHGHSRKKNTFFYGPAYGISEPNYYKCRILPKLIEKIDSNFRFHSCSFTIDEEKKQTARAVMFEHLRIAYTFTIETSIGYYYDCVNLKTVQFTKDEWAKVGASIG
jgi:cytosolic carboxypeptidase protein 2/3